MRAGIGFYLGALIVAAVVPLLIIAAILIAHQRHLQKDAIEKSLLQTALALSVAVDRQLDSYRVMLDTLAEDEALDRGNIAPFHALSERVAARHDAVFVSLFDREGRQIFNTLRPAGEKLPTPFNDPRVRASPDRPPVGDPSGIRQALETGHAAVSDLTYGLVAQRLIFVVNVPVLRDGKVRYVLNAAFDPAVMTRLLQENARFSGVPAVIFDRKGFIVGRWKDADKLIGTRARSFGVGKMTAGSGVDQGVLADGTPVYFSYALSPVTGWGVNIATPVAELEAALTINWLQGAMLAAGGLAAGLLLAMLLAAQLRRSIVRLADAAARNEPPRTGGLRPREIVEVERALAESAAAREERVAAEARKAQAEEASRAKDRFIAVLSHELRNPLAPLRTVIPLLRELTGRHDPELLRRLVDVIDRQSAQLTRLVNDLLDISRIATGKIELRRGAVDVRDVVHHAIETVTPALEARRHRLRLELSGEPVLVDADHARLAQVLVNLLDNAIKFTPEGGQVAVTLGAAGGTMTLGVRDNGLGMAPEMLKRIFTPFAMQEVQDSRRGAGGLGLGLSIARSLAELHGGTLEAKSDGPDQGSEFILRLPLA